MRKHEVSSTLSDVGMDSNFRHRLISLICLLFALCAVATGQDNNSPTSTARQANRVIVISLDGLDARYLAKRDEFGLRIPTLRRLMADGVVADGVISVYPSVTYPAHTTIVTGALPARHGILANEAFAPADSGNVRELQWFATSIKADTLWNAASRRRLKTGMVSWPVGVGAGDFSFPEILALNGSLKDTLELVRANDRPNGFVEELEKQDASLYNNVNKDEGDDMRTRFAEYVISDKRPDLVLVHLFDLDHFEHDFGPFTPEAFAILEKVDGYVGRILSAAERAGLLNDTMIFIVSDHGFKPIKKRASPGVLLAEAGLVKVREEKDAKGRARTVISSWRALPYCSSASCAIILRNPNDRDALRRARSIFKNLEGQPGSGIYRVVDPSELRKLGTNPRAAFMIDAEESFTFGSDFSGPFIEDTSKRGQHGYLPSRPDYRTSLIISGAGVTRRGSLAEVRMIDIAPTVARVLHLNLRNSEGTPIRLKEIVIRP